MPRRIQNPLNPSTPQPLNSKNLSTKKNRGEKIHSPPGLKLLIGTTKELRSRYRDIWKLVFLFLRGRLFLGGLLSFFLSCHID